MQSNKLGVIENIIEIGIGINSVDQLNTTPLPVHYCIN